MSLFGGEKCLPTLTMHLMVVMCSPLSDTLSYHRYPHIECFTYDRLFVCVSVLWYVPWNSSSKHCDTGSLYIAGAETEAGTEVRHGVNPA